MKPGLEEKKKKSRGRGNVQTTYQTSPCASAHRHFCHLSSKLPSLSFLPILERKLFHGIGEKTSRPHHHFQSSLPSQPNTFQINLSPHFISLSFFFFPSSLKFTLPNTPLVLFLFLLYNNYFQGYWSNCNYCIFALMGGKVRN